MGVLYKWILKGIELIIALFAAALIVVVFGNVLSRFVFHVGIAWAEESSRFLFIWLSFLGAVLVNDNYGHMHLDYLVKKVPEGFGISMQVVSLLITLGVLLILTLGGITVVLENLNWKSSALEIPYGYVYLVVPFSFIIMIGQTIVRIFKVIIRKEIDPK